MKRLIWAALLAVLCAALVAAVPAIAEQTSGDWQYELTSEGLVITGFAGSQADVVIPDEIGGNKVSIIGRQAFADNHTMKTLVIPEGITAIRAEAFYGCTGLSRIEFNAKDCSVPGIWIYDGARGAGVFSGAGSASSSGLEIIFGDSVARVPDHLFDTASIDEYGLSGYPCAGVTAVALSDSIKEIGGCAFRSCQALESVSFGAGLKTIGGYAFYGCTRLDGLAFDDALTAIGECAFFGNTALESIEWGAGLESIGESAFRGCASLEALALVNPLTTIERQAFCDCAALKTLSLPESLVNLRAEAFFGCIKLGEIEINCANLSVPDIWVYDGSKGAGVFSGAGSASTAGLKVTFGDSVARVPDHLFDTASLDEYGHGGYACAFVTEAVFSDAVKQIGGCAFRSCQSLKQLTFGRKLETIEGYAFWGCTALPTVAFDDALLTIGDSAFFGNTALESIEWGAGLESIGSAAFRGCTSLGEVALAAPLTTVGSQAFADCTAMKSLLLPESVVNLNAEAFYNCVRLERIRVESANLTVPDIWIYDGNKGAGVFSGAGSASPSGLEVSFGDRVTKVPDHLFDTASIDEYGHNGYPYAFVTRVDIPESVTDVGAYAFRSCQSLETVCFNGMDAMFGEGAFTLCTAQGFHIECPAGGFVEWFALSEGLACAALEAQQPQTQSEPQAPAEPEPAAEIEAPAEPEPEAPAQSAAGDGTWTCSNGHAGNTGKFCPECGEPRPENVCLSCGYAFPDGAQYKFCPECGAAQ